MENAIEELIKIEDRAKQETNRLDAARRKLPARIATHTAAIRASVEQETQDEVNALKARLAFEADEQVAALRASCETRVKALEALYAQNADTWCAQLRDDVIGR